VPNDLAAPANLDSGTRRLNTHTRNVRNEHRSICAGRVVDRRWSIAHADGDGAGNPDPATVSKIGTAALAIAESVRA
jgi:hypothetical protein